MTSLNKRALLIAGLHYLMSFAIIIFGVATAWASAASGAKEGLVETVVFGILQPLMFLMSRLHVEFPLGAIFLLPVPSSLLYGYLIAYLPHLRQPHRAWLIFGLMTLAGVLLVVIGCDAGIGCIISGAVILAIAPVVIWKTARDYWASNKTDERHDA